MLMRTVIAISFLLVIACAGLRCAGNGPVEGVAFFTGREGQPLPLKKKKVTLYRGALPDKIKEAFPWQDEGLVRRFSSSRPRLYDRGPDLIVVSACGDIPLPESLRLEEWCRLKEESYREKIARNREWQAFCEKEKAKAERSSSKLMNDLVRDEASMKECRGLSARNLEAARHKKSQEEQARKMTREHLGQFKYYEQCVRDDYAKGKQHPEESEIYGQYAKKYREDIASMDQARAAGTDSMRKVQSLSVESAGYFRAAAEQLNRATMYSILVDARRADLVSHRELIKSYNERIWKLRDRSPEKSAREFRDAQGPILTGLELTRLAGKSFARGRAGVLLKELGRRCSLKMTTQIPGWYTLYRLELFKVFNENMVAECTTGDDGTFRFTRVPAGAYYIVIEGVNRHGEETIVLRKFKVTGARERLLVGDDFAYRTEEWGFLRNGLSLFFGKEG